MPKPLPLAEKLACMPLCSNGSSLRALLTPSHRQVPTPEILMLSTTSFLEPYPAARVRAQSWSARRSAMTALLLSLFTLAFLRTAWITEDAFITFRVIDNITHNLGATWNPVERVQVYTHPMWLALLTPFVALTGEPYFTTLSISYALLLISVALPLFAAARWDWSTTFCISALLASKSFMDYTSSGLENPLTNALLGVYLWVWFKGKEHRAFWLSTITSSLFLCRPDAAVLIGIGSIYTAWHTRKWRQAAAGCTLALAWIVFSLFYYGSPAPNTALAKVGNGVPLYRNIDQALNYLAWSMAEDSVGMVLLGSGWLLALADRRTRPIGIGMALWAAYLMYVGGDYMGGRFFSAPIYLSVALLSICQPDRTKPLLAIAIITIAPVTWVHSVAAPSNFSRPSIAGNGIADERGYYYARLGLLSVLQIGSWREHQWFQTGQQLRITLGQGIFTRCTIGMVGYAGGPALHWIDPLALADPFLARLPARSNARVGHYERAFPPGYLDSILSGTNQLRDPKLRALYGDVVSVTRGPLLEPSRWLAIWRLNNGTYRDLDHFDRDAVHLPGIAQGPSGPFTCFGLPSGGRATWQLAGPPAVIARRIPFSH